MLDKFYNMLYTDFMDKKYRLEKLDEGAKLYSFMIDAGLLDWLKKEAEERKIPVSQLIRECIETYMRFTEASR